MHIIHSYIVCMHTCMHTHIHIHVHTYIQSMRAFIHTCTYIPTAIVDQGRLIAIARLARPSDTYMRNCVHIYIHTYMYTYIHTYIHIHIYTYTCIYMHTYIHTDSYY